jgi:hypothetical protein
LSLPFFVAARSILRSHNYPLSRESIGMREPTACRVDQMRPAKFH